MTQTASLIKLTLTPEQVSNVFPNEPEDGFYNKPLTVSSDNEGEVTFLISYDGESELLAQITENPNELSDQQAQQILEGYLSLSPEEAEEQ
jgi:hypothetical protein